MIDGFTGEQRVFVGWAQVWRGKAREEAAIVLLKTDSHSPGSVRGTATLKNQPGFYEAFGVKAGDKMYLPPEERVTIWSLSSVAPRRSPDDVPFGPKCRGEARQCWSLTRSPLLHFCCGPPTIASG